VLKTSIEYGLAHRKEAVDYALQFGRGLDFGLADRFIGMYVNKWTLDYGYLGRRAIRELLRMAHEIGMVPATPTIDFV
jgi:1,4-dihydroxy-6-naphthoate synthase